MPAAAAQKITYEGVHRYSVDANRRVQMPFRWRSPKPVEFTIILWPQHDSGPCLRVLPPAEMEKLRDKIEAMPATEKTGLKRHIGSHSERMKLDGANRLGIPENLFTKTGIKDQIVFVGMLDYFELWTPDRYAVMDALEQPVVVRGLKLLE
jgi:MraZ protein